MIDDIELEFGSDDDAV